MGAAVTQAAAFTLLNPHVDLDAVLLVGSMGAQQPAHWQGWFVAGVSVASALWFGSLGFGARWLAPWFALPRDWLHAAQDGGGHRIALLTVFCFVSQRALSCLATLKT